MSRLLVNIYKSLVNILVCSMGTTITKLVCLSLSEDKDLVSTATFIFVVDLGFSESVLLGGGGGCFLDFMILLEY